MLELANIDLRTDADAREYVKDEVVGVEFAQADGALISREGPNHYRTGDALITGSTGDRWSVSRELSRVAGGCWCVRVAPSRW